MPPLFFSGLEKFSFPLGILIENQIVILYNGVYGATLSIWCAATHMALARNVGGSADENCN